MDEWALITGASKGIGRSLAHVCAEKGHNLFLIARTASLLQELQAELSKKHRIRVEILAIDLSESDAPRVVHRFVKEKGIHISLLVNNAGLGSCGSFVELSYDRELLQIRLNNQALVGLTHLFLPEMISEERGRILNIASTAAFQPGPYMSVYYATKAFVLSFSQALQYELRGSNVTVTVHCPGPTESSFAAQAGNDKTLLFKSGQVATSRAVAEHAYHSMMLGRKVVAHGLINKFTATFAPFTPVWLTNFLAARINSPV